MPTWRRTVTRMSRRSRGRHSQIAAVVAAIVVVGNEGTGAIGMWAVVGIGGRMVLRCAVVVCGVREQIPTQWLLAIEEAPQSHRQPLPTQRGTARVRRRASASATSIVGG